MHHNAMRRGGAPSRQRDVNFGGESLLPSVELETSEEIVQLRDQSMK
jgi:hypothetical protein